MILLAVDGRWLLHGVFDVPSLYCRTPLTKPADSLPALPLLKVLDLSFNSLQTLPVFPPNCPMQQLDLRCNLLDGTCTRSFENVTALLHLRLEVRAACQLENL